MNILFFARRFYPLIGGVEKHCLLLGKELLKRGHKLTIVTEWDYGEIEKEYAGKPPEFFPQEVIEGIQIYRIPVTLNQTLKKWQIWYWLSKHLFILSQADLIHFHDVFYWFLPFKVLFPTKKAYITFHGYEGNQPPNWRKKLSHQLGAKLTRGNICIGDFQAKWYGLKPTYISYGAVDDNFKFQISNFKFNTKYDLCYIGRLAEDVGITVYLQAMKILQNTYPQLSMVVCGDGPLMQASQDYVKTGDLKVSFRGFTPEALTILAQSRIALNSRYLVILEALQMEKPIIAVYDNAIKKDYLALAPFAKWITIVKTPAETADAISAILSNNGKDAITTNQIVEGRLWAMEQTWGKMTDLYISLWKIQKSA